MPEVCATDGVEDGVHALAREAINFLHVVLTPIIDCTAVQISSPRVSALSEREPDFAIFRIRPPSKVRCCPDCSRGECQSWVGCCPNYGSASWTGAEGTSGGENGSLSQ